MARWFMSRLLSAHEVRGYVRVAAALLRAGMDDAFGFEQHHLAGRIRQHVDVEGFHAAGVAVREKRAGPQHLQDCRFAPGIRDLDPYAPGQDDAEVFGGLAGAHDPLLPTENPSCRPKARQHQLRFVLGYAGE